MRQGFATVLAFVAASLVPAIYLAVLYPLSGERDWQSVLGTFVVVYAFAAAATALVGFPAFLVLSLFKFVTWWSALGGGALVGGTAYFAVTSGRLLDTQSSLRFTVMGAVSGLTFWLFWRTGLSIEK